jgi:hypothetical protein
VTLVKKSCVERLKVHLTRNYKAETGLDCECYEAVPSAGAGSLDITPYLQNKADGSNNNWLAWLVPVTVGVLTVGVLSYIALSKKSAIRSLDKK